MSIGVIESWIVGPNVHPVVLSSALLRPRTDSIMQTFRMAVFPGLLFLMILYGEAIRSAGVSESQ